MDEGTSTLSYAVHGRVVAKYLGQLIAMLAILTLAPLGASVIFNEYELSLRYLVVILVLSFFTIPLLRLPVPTQVQTNEALTVVALAFILAPLFMSFPLMGEGLSFLDALFEAVSAITTTGLSTLATVEDKSQTFLFARAWMQWYGGLGIVVLSVALLMGQHMAARRLVEPIGGAEGLVTTARAHARRMLVVYGVLTGWGLWVLWAILGDFSSALSYGLSAVSTGGFSPSDESLLGLDTEIARWAVILLALGGAIPLPLYYLIYHSGWRQALTNRDLRAFDMELRALSLMGLVGGGILAWRLDAWGAASWAESFSQGLLLGFSALTTAGFSNLEVAALDPASKLWLMGMMSVGGGIGSTAGGIKILRLLIFLRLVQLLIERTALPPQAVHKPRLAGKVLQEEEIQQILLLIVLFGLVVMLSWLVFVLLGEPPLDALFEVISATGTVGLSTGITGPELHPLLKLLLCIDMLLGRLEIIALLVLCYPRTWIGRRAQFR
ncbi:cation transporter [Nitrosococcus halophilus Nc 4]|uniref:Cation transporter n=2 Tax=Nitrosococcus halophilus TaxID=133539 RepID=D5BZV6_NITHN|nr:cation transporter [Nitrosococcus halophilus Nc 4]